MRRMRIPDAGGTDGGPREAGNTASASDKRPIQMKRRRGTRGISLESEIRAKAKQIRDDQMAEAMKAAALMIVARKQDEIIALLRSVGATNFLQAPTRSTQQIFGVGAQPTAQPAAIEHPCVQCGREGIKRTKPNQWNRTGSWYCQVHAGLAAKTELEDAQDAVLIGPQKGPQQKAPVVVTHPPAAMVQETQIQPTSTGPQDAPGAATMDDAFSALGVQ
jgi:hypothetical protein